jgi:DNA polymerase-3 subunit gamma/tau
VAPAPPPAPQPVPTSFEALVKLVEAREPILGAHLRNNVHLVHFEPGRLEFRSGEHAPADLAPRLGTLLHGWTGRRWLISLSNATGEPSLAQAAKRLAADRRLEAEADPLVQAVLKSFPGATIEAVREPAPAPATAAGGGDDAEPGYSAVDSDIVIDPELGEAEIPLEGDSET